mmetsp:Transcript_18086/g.37558  ORF Transcript_18086/g.37558 Transcript_18086/m.37558 type:complete len:111 (-) Transcript_18086:2391-2723(-)
MDPVRITFKSRYESRERGESNFQTRWTFATCLIPSVSSFVSDLLIDIFRQSCGQRNTIYKENGGISTSLLAIEQFSHLTLFRVYPPHKDDILRLCSHPKSIDGTRFGWRV